MRYANQQRAFTIIELLVVIGVIAVLSAILLPAIGTARNNAKTTTANSNLRQIGTAVAKYQNQNKDRFIDNKYKLGCWWDTFYTPSIITVLPRQSEDSLRGHD